MKFGIDRLIADPALRQQLAGKRVALVAHPASVTADLTHSLDALAKCPEITLTAAFGPQHGLRGDKQDNMMESPDFTDPQPTRPTVGASGDFIQACAGVPHTRPTRKSDQATGLNHFPVRSGKMTNGQIRQTPSVGGGTDR
jgi:hypothetical protein